MDRQRTTFGMAFSAWLFPAVCLIVVSQTAGLPTNQQMCVERFKTFADYARRELISVGGDDLMEICQMVPREYKVVCRSLLTSFGENVDVEDSDEYISALCRMFYPSGADDNDSQDSPFVIEDEMDSSDVEMDHHVPLPCILCVNIMRLAHTFLQDKQHQDMLLRLLRGVCNFLPLFKSECTNLVNQYGPLVVHLAANWLRPELCRLFHLCSQELVNNADSCRLCELGVGIIRDTIDDPELETRITGAVELVCKESNVDQKVCNDLRKELKDYLPDVIKSLRQNTDFSAICKESSFCMKDEDAVYDIADIW